MADFRFDQFGDALAARLEQLGYSFSRATEKWPDTDRAMLSRAVAGKPLSAGNVLLLCEMAGLDPFAFLVRAPSRRVTMKTILDQAVTAPVSRETGRAER